MFLTRMIVPLLALAFLASSPAARADVLPGEAIGEDVVAVIWLDTGKLDGKQLLATAAALLGAESKGLIEPLGELEKMREPFVKAGGKGIAIVFRGPDENGRPPEPYFLIPLAQNTDPDAAVEAIKKIVGGNAPVSKLSDRALVVVPERWKPAKSEPGDVHKAFEKALVGAGDAPAAVVFIPNDAMRKLTGPEKADLEQMEQFMPGMAAAFRLGLQACEMKQIVATAKLGTDAKVSFAAEAADADGAKLLVQRMKEAGEGFAKLAQAGRGAPPEAIKAFALLNTLLTKTDTKVAGTRVTVDVAGDNLKTSLQVIAEMAMLGRQRANQAVLGNQIRQLSVAITAYAVDHNGDMPDKLDDLVKYVGGAEELAKLMQHPGTGEKVGVGYVKPAKKLTDIQRPGITAILFEMKDGKIDAKGWVGYADGHVGREQTAPVAPAGAGFKDKQ